MVISGHQWSLEVIRAHQGIPFSMVAVSRLSSRLHFSFDSTITCHKRGERTVANQAQSSAIKANQAQSSAIQRKQAQSRPITSPSAQPSDLP